MNIRFFLFSLFLLSVSCIQGQTDTLAISVDTTIYKVADELPRFPNPCERLDTTIIFKNQCSEQSLLRFITSRSIYPQEAREKGISGTPVISFIVEPNGIVNAPKIVRDPGGNLGLAALQAVLSMQQQVRWRPAIKDGKPVRFQFNLPVRFKLEDPKPYVLVEQDTVYTEFSKRLEYKAGNEALQLHFQEQLKYPETWKDSCLVGQMDVRILVQPNNIVRILDITDYNNLGFDFWYEAIHTATSTYGKWNPAEYEGRKVPAAFDLSMSFLPESAVCKTVLDNYEKAANQISEGSKLAQEKSYDDAIEKMDEAVALFPYDGQFRIIRGQTLMDANRLGEACQDLALARRIALVNWFDAVLPLLCKPNSSEE